MPYFTTSFVSTKAAAFSDLSSIIPFGLRGLAFVIQSRDFTHLQVPSVPRTHLIQLVLTPSGCRL